MRIKIFNFFLIIIFVFLILALFYFQIMRNNRYWQLSMSNCIRLIPQEGVRGKILDRNGDIIVDSRLSYNVLFFPQENRDFQGMVGRLSQILDLSAEELGARFRRKRAYYFSPVTLAEDIEIKQAIGIEEQKSELPGVMIQIEPIRHYPYGKLAAHLLGYLGEIDHWRLSKLKDYGYESKDIVGYGGVEERYDYYLREDEGGLQVEVDNRGKITRVIGLKPPRNGKDVELTIDLKIQRIAEQAIGDRIGAVVIMDPYSGDILGMVSCPAFSPSVFLRKTSLVGSILRDADAPLVNRAITGAYPPGSVFKIVVASAGLDSRKIDTETSFYCTGSLMIGRQQYDCWSTHGTQNLESAIAHSCNVFFYHLGLLLGPGKIYEYAQRLGFGRTAQIDLPAESAGALPVPVWNRFSKTKGWFPGDTANFAIGQGALLATPLQLARLLAAFANEAYFPRPHLIKAIDGREMKSYKKIAAALGLRKEVIVPIKRGLERVVTAASGTASILAIPGVSVSGKTGTAQAPPGQPHAWFAGFFPSQKPKFAICVFLEHAGPSINACAVARDIIEAMQKENML